MADNNPGGEKSTNGFSFKLYVESTRALTRSLLIRHESKWILFAIDISPSKAMSVSGLEIEPCQ